MTSLDVHTITVTMSYNNTTGENIFSAKCQYPPHIQGGRVNCLEYQKACTPENFAELARHLYAISKGYQTHYQMTAFENVE